MNNLIGFLIALAVGLKGIGGGSFTVLALVLLAACLRGKLWERLSCLPACCA
jgi:hypothetical protein